MAKFLLGIFSCTFIDMNMEQSYLKSHAQKQNEAE